MNMTQTFIQNHVSFRSGIVRPVSYPYQKPQLQWSPIIGFESRRLIMLRVLPRAEHMISSNVATLVKEEEHISKKNAPLVKDDDKRLADCWREIHGEDDWSRLLDPMDPILRSELIRYGEMAQACYDAFDFDPYSKYYGSCKYSRDRFFQSLDMEDNGYEVLRYVYATSNVKLPNFFKKSRWPKVWSNDANWIGYVAVSNDETSKHLGRRDIVIAWRGTVTCLEWISDLMDILKPVSSNEIPSHDPTVRVESGFVNLYTDRNESCKYCRFSAREQVVYEVTRLMDMYKDEELSITITGHSLGAALAILSAYDIAETGLHIRQDGQAMPVCAFSYSGPRVGNFRFKERLEGLGVKVLRVVNVHDMVPKTPGFFVNEHTPREFSRMSEGFLWSYFHVGEELVLDHKNSPFLKNTNDPVCAHNLEALLHLLDGYHGRGRRFGLSSERDITLVNKECDFLKDHYEIPPCWRQDENKGMLKGKDGRWMQAEQPRHDDQPEDMHHHLTQSSLLPGH